MYLYTGASTTRRRQSPTKSIVVGPSISSDKSALQHQTVTRNTVVEIEGPTWYYMNPTDDMNSATRRSTRKVLYFLIILWLSFIVASIVQYYNYSDGDQTSLLVKEESDEFMKTFKNAPMCEQIDSEDVDYTLVTHSSEDRLWMMEHHCLRWGHYNPISIAIFTNMETDEIYSKLEVLGCARESIILQTISIQSKQDTKSNLYDQYKHRLHYPTIPNNESSAIDYPINELRNLALSAVKTSHAFIVDIDFLPSENLFRHLHRNHIEDALAADSKQALVVPAFQLNRGCPLNEECDQKDIQRMPYSRDELKLLIRQGSATIFDPTNRGGHGTTNYRAWMNEYNTGLAEIPCIKSKRYEPFVVIRYCHTIPPFQERFNGYGKNKLSWILHIIRAGYQIDQIDIEFIIHYPHKDSPSRKRWNKRPNILKQNMKVDQLEPDAVDWSEYKRGQIDALYLKFNAWLESEVGNQARTPMCEVHEKEMNLWVPHQRK